MRKSILTALVSISATAALVGCNTVDTLIYESQFHPEILGEQALKHYREGNADLGNKFLDKARSVVSKSQNSKDLSLHYMLRGYICWRYQMEHGANCSPHYEAALSHAKQSGVQLQEAIVLLEYSWYKLKAGEREEGCKLLSKAGAVDFPRDYRSQEYVDYLPFGFYRTKVGRIEAIRDEECPNQS